MKSIYHNERVFFQVTDVRAEILPGLHAAARGCEFLARKHRRTGRLGVTITLRNKKDAERLCKFVRKHKLRQTKYGLRISLVTERDSDGLRVPEFALWLWRRIGGPLDFSFTSIDPND